MPWSSAGFSQQVFKGPEKLFYKFLHFVYLLAEVGIFLQHFEEDNPNQVWKTIAQKELSAKVRHLKLDVTDLIG